MSRTPVFPVERDSEGECIFLYEYFPSISLFVLGVMDQRLR